MKKKKTIISISLLIFVIISCFWYINDFYHSDFDVQNYLQSNTFVTVTEIENGYYLDGIGEENALIFYPGAKVEYTAYLPILYQLAEQGMDCFLIKMPCNLAIFGKDKAEEIRNKYKYKNWYLSGHSLGGAMAASYTAEHLDQWNGVILFAAYPTKSLKADSLSVLSIYGSEDGVLNRDKWKKGRDYMPSDYTELCIEGGNHAWFGNYGEQKGDGKAAISHQEQQQKAIEAILQMVFPQSINQ